MLDILAVLLGILTLPFVAASVSAMRRRFFLKTAGHLCLVLVLFSVTAFLAALAVATRGYRALTREDVVAVVSTEPIGPQRFSAHFQFPDGRQASFELAGDALYVDAHILKWKPVANLLGLHTSYELDRVSGRYARINEERSKPRTLYSLSRDKPIGMFELRKSHDWLEPLLDAQYGSATFGPISEPGRFELRVSTTGLLLRHAPDSSQAP